jgi:SAM-dependent MidA family methyltransferase
MEVALYHPEHGYYRRGKDPFGAGGDYFTAEQVQPSFGILIRSVIRSLTDRIPGGSSEDAETTLSVVEPGAGRAEMAEFFDEFRYVPVEHGDSLPSRFHGVVFANEFFDALPVHVAVRRGDEFREMSVGFSDARFHWNEGDAVRDEVAEFLARYAGDAPEGAIVEANTDALDWIERIGGSMDAGFVLVIDYGYTARELIRFPRGTLMSYRRHRAFEDVLALPGECDITAHVPFTALEQHAAGLGMMRERFQSLATLLLDAGESSQFQEVLGNIDEAEERRCRLQLKQLLFGMGETFRVLLLGKNVAP